MQDQHAQAVADDVTPSNSTAPDTNSFDEALAEEPSANAAQPGEASKPRTESFASQASHMTWGSEAACTAFCPTECHLTPERIPKAVVFVDSIPLLMQLVFYLVLSLRRCGYPLAMARVVVRGFHAQMAEYDKTRIYTEFLSTQSRIRILVATSAMGLGMDIPDIRVVIQWMFTIGQSIAELWQRFGRAARAPDQLGYGVIFLPHWAFGDQGKDPLSSAQTRRTAQSTPRRKMKKVRNMTVSDRRASRLSQSQTIEDVPSPSESEVSESTQPVLLAERQSKVRTWTKQELANRAKLSPDMRGLCNSRCRRSFFLNHLQESKSDATTRDPAPSPERCCNGPRCNAELFPGTRKWPPPGKSASKKPRVNSRAHFALRRIEAECRARALEASSTKRLKVVRPAWVHLPEACQWDIARCFDAAYVGVSSFPIQTKDDLLSALATENRINGKRFESHLAAMVPFLHRIAMPVFDEYSEHLQERQKTRGKGEAATIRPGEQDTETQDLQETRSQADRDNARGLLVAIQRRDLNRRIEGNTQLSEPVQTPPSVPEIDETWTVEVGPSR